MSHLSGIYPVCKLSYLHCWHFKLPVTKDGRGWVLVLVNFQCRGVLLIWMVVGACSKCGWGCLDIFFLTPIIFHFFLPLSGRRFDRDGNTV